jgi:hypothetical protein
VLTDIETWQPAQPAPVAGAGNVPLPLAASAFIEDEDLPVLTPLTLAGPMAVPAAPPVHEDRIAMLDRLERDALTKRYRELDRRSEALAAEQQRSFAERLDAAIAAELAPLRERRQVAVAEIENWAAGERARVTNELAAEERRFAERLMAQLTDFETQLGERLREQEQKLAGWWSEAERLADDRMRAAMREVNAA